MLIFALLALFVASIGLYGIMSYFMSQRTREFGIRVAVGQVAALFFALSSDKQRKLVSIGICFGSVGAMLLARSIRWPPVRPFDPAIFASVSILLALVALLASYIPARRVASVDPMIALRHD